MPTALIVEDDPLVQALITFKLERAGFTVLQEGTVRPDWRRAPTITSLSR